MHLRLMAALCFCLLYFNPSLCDALTLRFDDLPKLIRTKNLKVSSQDSLVKSSKVQTRHLARSFLPKIKAYGGGETFHTLNNINRTDAIAGVEAQLNLIGGGRDFVENSIRNKNLEIAKTSAERVYLLELQRARNLYVQILFFKELQSHFKGALYRNGSHLRMVRAKIQAGLTTKIDQVEFQIEANRLKQESAIISEEYEHSVEMLQAVLNLKLGSVLKLTDNLSHDHNDPIFKKNQNVENNFEIKMLEKEVRLTDLKKKKEGLWWSPSVDLYGMYNVYPFREREQASVGNRDEIVGGIQLKMNIFDGLIAATKAKSYKHKSRSLKLASQQQKKELEAHKRRLKHILKLRHKLVHTNLQTMRQSEEYLSLTKKEYELGTKNSPDVLSASQRILDSKKRYSEIRRDFLVTKNELVMLFGD